jgi:hypothetical protein
VPVSKAWAVAVVGGFQERLPGMGGRRMMRFICRALMCGTMVSELVPEAGVRPFRNGGWGGESCERMDGEDQSLNRETGV